MVVSFETPAQTAPPPNVAFIRDGVTPYRTWIDGVWTAHLLARAEKTADIPLLSEAFMRDALRVRPADTNPVLALARFYRDQQIIPLDEMAIAYGRRLDPTVTAWKELAAEKKKTPRERTWTDADETRHQEAGRQFAAGRYLDAEVGLRALLKDHPGEQKVLTDLGMLYVKTADWGMAASVFAFITDRFPDDTDAANNLAVCFDQVGRPDLVTTVLEAQLLARPDDVYLIRNICHYAMASGDIDKALAFGAKWTALDAENPDARVAYARLLLRAQRAAEALAEAEAARLLAPDRLDIVALLVEIHYAAGEFDAARAALAELAAAMPPEEYRRLVALAPFSRFVEPVPQGETP
jgi:Flp pilus assembly protein TadD